MAQTQGASLSWTISNFRVEETAAGAATPAEILPPNTSFDLKVDFDGSGAGWNALEIAGASFTVKFYAEGIGAAANEIDFGSAAGNLSAGGGPYTGAFTVAAGITTEGVYRLGCLIEVSPGSGVVGFEENLLISVATGA